MDDVTVAAASGWGPPSVSLLTMTGLPVDDDDEDDDDDDDDDEDDDGCVGFSNPDIRATVSALVSDDSAVGLTVVSDVGMVTGIVAVVPSSTAVRAATAAAVIASAAVDAAAAASSTPPLVFSTAAAVVWMEDTSAKRAALVALCGEVPAGLSCHSM